MFLNKKLFNELVTNFFTLNGSLLSFAIASYSFIALALNKFKAVNIELFQWISNPDISIGFTLDGLSGIMLAIAPADFHTMTRISLLPTFIMY